MTYSNEEQALDQIKGFAGPALLAVLSEEGLEAVRQVVREEIRAALGITGQL